MRCMNTIYILIVVLVFTPDNRNSVAMTATQVEFSSKAKCDAALKQLHTNLGGNVGVRSAGCYEK